MNNILRSPKYFQMEPQNVAVDILTNQKIIKNRATNVYQRDESQEEIKIVANPLRRENLCSSSSADTSARF